MAVDHKSVSGSYDKTVEDSSHQASKKFSNPIQKPTDDMKKPSQKANPTKQGAGEQHAT